MSGNTRFFIWMGVLGFISLVIISMVIYSEYKNKRRLKRLIKKQKEEK